MPRPLTRIFGRAHDIELIRGLLVQDNLPLVTLAGPGGVGKTRLAQEVGRAVGKDFASGAAFVDLSRLQLASQVLTAIAQAVGVQANAGRSVFSALVDNLSSQQMLLVLDNVEHVLDAAPEVAALLGECPALQIVATSRAPLRVRGERVVPVEPLPIPDPSHIEDLATLAAIPAAALLIERAREVDTGFTLSASNAEAVVTLCRRLDGLPLAIELAAPRLRVLSPDALLAVLEDRLRTESGAPRDAPSRHRSLHAAIAWSYELLTARDQETFRGLSVFVGGFDLESAAAALSVDSATMSRGIEALYEQSLLLRGPGPGGEPRFVMLETVREFAAEQLRAGGEDSRVRMNHANHVLAKVQAISDAFYGPRMAEFLDQMDTDYPNTRAALDFYAETGESERELRLAAMHNDYWFFRGHVPEGINWLASALERGLNASARVRGRASSELAFLHYIAGNRDLGRQFGEDGIRLSRAGGDPWEVSQALFVHANTLGYGFQHWSEAVELLEEAELHQWHDNPYPSGTLGEMYVEMGEVERGVACIEQTLPVFRKSQLHAQAAFQLMALGRVAVNRGEDRAAAAHFAEALTLMARATAKNQMLFPLAHVVLLASKQRLHITTARLLGMVDRFIRMMGLELHPNTVDAMRIAEKDARRQCGDSRFYAHFEAGLAISVSEAIAEAVSVAEMLATEADVQILESRWPLPGIDTVSQGRYGADQYGLTPRQTEVLRLVVHRYTDREIADQLFIGYRTATSHVSQILGKLGARNRRDAAAIAVRVGLV